MNKKQSRKSIHAKNTFKPICKWRKTGIRVLDRRGMRPLVFRPHELVIHHGQVRAGTPARQPVWRPALFTQLPNHAA
jgi:hypothetical protein